MRPPAKGKNHALLDLNEFVISFLSLFKLQLWKITKWFQVLKIRLFWGVVNHNIDGRSYLSIRHYQHGPICYRDAFVEVRRLVGNGSWNAVIAWPLVAIWHKRIRPVKRQGNWVWFWVCRQSKTACSNKAMLRRTWNSDGPATIQSDFSLATNSLKVRFNPIVMVRSRTSSFGRGQESILDPFSTFCLGAVPGTYQRLNP